MLSPWSCHFCIGICTSNWTTQKCFIDCGHSALAVMSLTATWIRNCCKCCSCMVSMLPVTIRRSISNCCSSICYLAYSKWRHNRSVRWSWNTLEGKNTLMPPSTSTLQAYCCSQTAPSPSTSSKSSSKLYSSTKIKHQLPRSWRSGAPWSTPLTSSSVEMLLNS